MIFIQILIVIKSSLTLNDEYGKCDVKGEDYNEMEQLEVIRKLKLLKNRR